MNVTQALIALGAASLSLAAQSSTVALAANGQWQAVVVDDFVSTAAPTDWIDPDVFSSGYGSRLSFDFTVAAGQVGTLTVVDAAFAGETFDVYNGQALLGRTSAVPLASFDPNAPSTGDFDLALADPSYSRGVFTLGAGTYQIRGALAQALQLDGLPLNANLGALKLTVSAVPEPLSWELVLAGFGVLAFISHRKNNVR